jgi:hypothetical protein
MPLADAVLTALFDLPLDYIKDKAIQILLGPEEQRALTKLRTEVLGEVLDSRLAAYPAVPKYYRNQLLGNLELALGQAARTADSMPTFGAADAPDLIQQARQHPSLDWSTFGVYQGDDFYRLDEAEILQDFLIVLGVRLRNEARRADSTLANLANQIDHIEILRILSDVVGQALAMSVAVGTAKDVAGARKRAADRQRGVVAARTAEDLARPQHIESGLMEQWLKWVAMPSWSAQVAEALRAVASALNGHDAVAARSLEAVAADAVTQPEPYRELQVKLSRLPLEAVCNALSKEKMRAGDPDGMRNGGAADRGAALHQALWLKQQVTKPEFHKCFNVAGSFGSGTSRFLTSVAQAVDGSGDLAVIMNIGSGESFGSMFLRQLSEVFGMDFRDIRDTAVLLDGEGGQKRRLYVLIEDADQQIRDEASLTDILRLVEASTAVPGIRWCFAANLDNLHAVLPSNDPMFWSLYGFVPKDRTGTARAEPDGWINLNALNVDRSVGLRLLQEVAKEERPDLQMVLAQPQAFASENATFANPLPAWMRFEAAAAGHSSHPVSDPQDPYFIGQYWSFLKLRHLRRDALSPTGTADVEAENTVRVLSQALQLSGKDFVPLDTTGHGDPGTISVDDQAALALRRMGLLRLSLQGDPTVEQLVLAAKPVFAPFWGYRIGRLVLADLHRGTDADYANLARALRVWYRQARSGESLAEAVCQYTLGGLTEEGTKPNVAVWQAWERDAQAPRVPLLMAGAAAPKAFSRFAVEMVTRPRYRPATKREAFVMMRLTAKASSPGWKADRRLALLSAQRDIIVRYGLHTYATYITRTILTAPGLVDRGNFNDTCTALLGCEQTGTAQIAALLMAENGLKLFGSHEAAVHATLGFFQRISMPIRQPGQPRRSDAKSRTQRPQGKLRVLTTPDGGTFPQQLVVALLSRLLQEEDAAETVRMLARLDWWTGRRLRIEPGMAFYMQQQLTLAFGRTVHRRGPDAAYVGVVEDLLDGTLLAQADHRERLTLAMYLIKHSVPTYARWNLRIDPDLHHALARLWNDRDFRSREYAKLAPLCIANEIPMHNN